MARPAYPTRRVPTIVGALLLAACVLALVASHRPAGAAFPGENGRIAFRSHPAPISAPLPVFSDIYTMLPDGTGRAQLITDLRGLSDIVWSPDGTKMAFTALHSSDDTISHIYTVEADGSNLTRLTSDATGGAGRPAWSPDGTKIAFQSSGGIYIMGADGSGVTRLTDGTGGSRDPTWSADGTKIAFARGYQYDSQPSIAGIWVMNADGSGQTNLTSAVLPIDGEVTSAQLDAPDWSPDGTKIAFERSFKVLGDILVINADGTGLVSYGRSDPNSWVTLDSPAWSPDGEKIAYTYRTDCLEPEQCVEYFSDIWVMDTDGTNRTNLTNTPDDWESIPDWQPLPLAHDFGGFFAPVNNPPTLNVVKAGRAVPVKFSLGGDKGLDVVAEGYPRSRRISCSSSAPLDAIEQRTSAAGGSGLSYDAATERYTYVWKIQKAWSGTCRQLVVRLDDGSFHRANFRFK